MIYIKRTSKAKLGFHLDKKGITMKRVLIACEESQRVCIEFRKRGYEAFSCDILPCSGGHPEWHIQDDVSKHLNEKWDLIIAHPPCTYLTISGNKYFNVDVYGDKARVRQELRKEAIDFFMMFVNAPCERIAIENPIGCMSSVYRKPDQIYNPFDFAGETECKKTCLWLKNLPKLTPTQDLDPALRTHNGYKAFFDGKQYGWMTLALLGFVLKRPMEWQLLWQNNGGR